VERVTLRLATGSYDVVVGSGALAEAGSLLGSRRRAVVVSQPAVAERHGAALVASLERVGAEVDVALLAPGEEAKSLAVVEGLCRRFARNGVLRDDAIVALGGGVVGDVAGFAAAVYHRGIDALQAPTTLLAQVDAAIGGKTAVNLPEGKNLVGAFHQPVGVVADVTALATLPAEEYRSGLGEVVKYALSHRGADAEAIAAILADERSAVFARDPDVLTRLVRACVAVKAEIVEADEQERTGSRALLNYGHTLAHALEADRDFGLRHGEAVAVGLVFAAELAHAMDRIDEHTVARHRALVSAVDLPTAVPEAIDAGALLGLMRRDKKASGGLTFVLDGPSGPELVSDPPPDALARALAAVGVRADVGRARG